HGLRPKAGPRRPACAMSGRPFTGSRQVGAAATGSRPSQEESELIRLAMADLRFAAWFLWITPLLTALSSWRDAARSSAVALSASPAWLASLSLRIAVFSDDLTDLLRSRAFS